MKEPKEKEPMLDVTGDEPTDTKAKPSGGRRAFPGTAESSKRPPARKGDALKRKNHLVSWSPR